jgi:hypothetical protein
MNASPKHRATGNRQAAFDHGVLAELLARHWMQDRAYFTLKVTAPGAWLEAGWRRQPGRSALELRWSRHAPCLPGGHPLPPPQAVFDGAA